jgi:hypothetical protein
MLNLALAREDRVSSLEDRTMARTDIDKAVALDPTLQPGQA